MIYRCIGGTNQTFIQITKRKTLEWTVMEWLVWSHLAESQKLLLPSQPITNQVKIIRLDQNPIKIVLKLRVVTLRQDP